MDRVILDQLLTDLIHGRFPRRQADELIQRVSSDPQVARAYAEAKLRAELAWEMREERRSERAARRRARKRVALARWLRRVTNWRGGATRS